MLSVFSSARMPQSCRDEVLCGVCSQRVQRRSLLVHTIQFHMPWWLVPQQTCWICYQFFPGSSIQQHYTNLHPDTSPPPPEALQPIWLRLVCQYLANLREEMQESFGCESLGDIVLRYMCHPHLTFSNNVARHALQHTMQYQRWMMALQH